MSPKTSWKDVIEERQKESFVGRKDYIKQFTENFASDIPNYLLFFVIGEGGVGKSTLLRQFGTLGKNPEIDAVVITCDDEQSSPVAAMGYIAEQLAKFDIISKEFNERYKTYRTRRDEIESDPKAPRGALNLVVRGMTDFAIKAARRTPGVGVFAEYVDEKEAGEALTQGINYLVDRIGNKDEVQLLREPEKILSPLFIELLNKACEEHRLVLMFDVFERTREALEPWLLEFLDFKFGGFNTGITCVISGRDTVDQRWTQIASSICYITLEPFTLEETRSYLRFRKITNKQLVAQVFEDTGGLPVLVELLAGTNPKPGLPLPDISKDAVKRFLQWIPEEDRRWVALLAAIPRNFNLDILSAALDRSANSEFNWLSVQSYIRTATTRGWFYHEKVRDLMLRHIRNTRPGELSDVHKRLGIFFEAQQNKMGLEKGEAYSSKTWQEFEIEKLYHLIYDQPDRNINIAVNAFLEALRWRQGVAWLILQVFQQVQRETSSRELKKTVDVLNMFYQAYDKDEYDGLLKQANQLAKYNNLTSEANAAFLRIRGDALLNKEKYEQALSDFDKAISLDEKYDLAIARRGHVYQKLSQFEKALIDLDRATELDDRFHWAYEQKGIVLRNLERYDEAIDSLTIASNLEEKCAVCIAERGVTYRVMGQLDKALVDFDSAIAREEKFASVILFRGQVYQELGKFEQALSDFNRVIELDKKHDWALAFRGHTYFLMNEFDLALMDFDHVLQLNINYDSSHWAYEQKGITLGKLNRYEEAIESLTLAEKTYDKCPVCIAERGDIYRKTEKYEQALADFDRAININGEYSWAIARRGETFREMGKYEQALTDFNLALLQNEKYTWAITQRGLAYFQMGKHEEALSDFDKAVALNAKDIRSLTIRAQVYRKIEKYDQALLDFDRTIVLNDKDENLFAQRGYTYHLMDRYKEALADFDSAILLNGEFHWAHEQRGIVLRNLKRYEESVTAFTQAHELEASCFACVAERGETFRQLRQYEKALADYDKAVELGFAKNRGAWLQGIIYRDMGNYQDAINKISLAIELDEKNARAFASRGEAYKRIGDFEKALSDFNHATELDEKLDFAFAFRGDLQRRLGNFELAIKDLSTAIELDPENDVFARSRRAVVYHAVGNVTLRDSDVSFVMGAKAEDDENFYNKAIVCVVMGKYEEAIQLLKSAFEEDPSDKIYAQTDDVLVPLSSLPEFQELMKMG